MATRHASPAGRRRPFEVRLPVGLLVGTAVLVSGCASPVHADGGNASAASTASAEPDTTLGPDAAAASVHPVTTVVVGDDAALSSTGKPATGSWPEALAAELAPAGGPLDVQVAAADGAGFAAGSAASSFTDLVLQKVEHSTQLVFFFETRYEDASAQEVQQGAELAFKKVEEQAPDELIVVVGPYRFAADAPAPGEDVRTAVHEAAMGAEAPVTYIDPMAEGWPAGADGRKLAELMRPHVADLAVALAQSGAFD